MLTHLPIAILMLLPLSHVARVADDIPKFDIARECRSEGGSKAMMDKCAEDEMQARNDLQAQWAQFGASARASCFQETDSDGTPSYVELLTCLEMARDTAKPSGSNRNRK